jgi:outer membrane protein
LSAAKAQIQATQAQVSASEIALNGVREEARVGQRTTLDVLNAQQALVNARVSMVTAQRDRVVASYTLLAATGRLSAKVLGLKVIPYDPRVHYHQVRDAWVGVRTPDGREAQRALRIVVDCGRTRRLPCITRGLRHGILAAFY